MTNFMAGVIAHKNYEALTLLMSIDTLDQDHTLDFALLYLKQHQIKHEFKTIANSVKIEITFRSLQQKINFLETLEKQKLN